MTTVLVAGTGSCKHDFLAVVRICLSFDLTGINHRRFLLPVGGADYIHTFEFEFGIFGSNFATAMSEREFYVNYKFFTRSSQQLCNCDE